MTDPAQEAAMVLLVLGALTVASVMVRKEFSRLRIPGMAGYILIGMALAWADSLTDFITPSFQHNIDFLAQLGVAVLLFRVGLESDLGMLARQLRKASIIWLPNMAVPAAAVFLTVYLWPGYGLVPALFAGVASSATSIGVSTAVWEETGQLDTPQGALLLDVAELDDASAVILLSILFSLTPLLKGAEGGSPWLTALFEAAFQIAKLTLFIAACYVFSRQFEKPLTAWFGRLDPKLGPLLFAAGTAFAIAASAQLIGFSIAIGALFAGLAFSRDPSEREIDQSFSVLFAVFGPFFFLAIGLEVEIGALGDAMGLGLALLAAAALGKFLGAGMPTALLSSRADGVLIGLSMIPRAEIFLIVMLFGVNAGDWAVTETLYTASIFVSLATCIFAPVAVHALLNARTRRKEGA
ncbi:MAG: cation:proton antiporter [Alphaproteobacteria bacterium]